MIGKWDVRVRSRNRVEERRGEERMRSYGSQSKVLLLVNRTDDDSDCGSKLRYLVQCLERKEKKKKNKKQIRLVTTRDSDVVVVVVESILVHGVRARTRYIRTPYVRISIERARE